MPYILGCITKCNLSMFCLVSYYKTSHSSNLGMPTSYFKLSDLQYFTHYHLFLARYCPPPGEMTSHKPNHHLTTTKHHNGRWQHQLGMLNTTTPLCQHTPIPAPNTCHHTFQNHHPLYSRTTHLIQTTKNKYHRKEGRGNNMIS